MGLYWRPARRLKVYTEQKTPVLFCASLTCWHSSLSTSVGASSLRACLHEGLFGKSIKLLVVWTVSVLKSFFVVVMLTIMVAVFIQQLHKTVV